MLVLVRHGESAGNAAGVLLGRTDSPLTERGRRQVVALRAGVRPGRVVTSPLRRARDSAALLAPDVVAEVDERWIELDYGVLDGAPLASVPATMWRSWRADVTFRPDAGESLAEMGARVRAACEELFSRDGEGARGDGDVVVVSHVSPVKAAVAWALGVGDEAAWHLYLAPASITRIGWGPAGPVLHAYNETVRDRPDQTGASTARGSGRAGGRLS